MSDLQRWHSHLISWNHAVVNLFPQNPEAQPGWGHQALHPLRQGSGPDAIPNGVQGAAHVEHPGQGKLGEWFQIPLLRAAVCSRSHE